MTQQQWNLAGLLILAVSLLIIIGFAVWRCRWKVWNFRLMHLVKRYGGHYEWMSKVGWINSTEIILPGVEPPDSIDDAYAFIRRQYIRHSSPDYFVVNIWSHPNSYYALCTFTFPGRWSTREDSSGNNVILIDIFGNEMAMEGANKPDKYRQAISIATDFQCLHDYERNIVRQFAEPILSRHARAIGKQTTPRSINIARLYRVIMTKAHLNVEKSATPNFETIYPIPGDIKHMVLASLGSSPHFLSYDPEFDKPAPTPRV